jgi:hypothetical protein
VYSGEQARSSLQGASELYGAAGRCMVQMMREAQWTAGHGRWAGGRVGGPAQLKQPPWP